MKLYKEDAGFYIVSMILGASIGIVVGSWLSYKKAQRMAKETAETMEIPTVELKKPKKDEKKKPMGNKKKVEDDGLTAYIDKYDPGAVEVEMIRSGLLTIDDAIAARERGVQDVNYSAVSNKELVPIEEVDRDKPELEELLTQYDDDQDEYEPNRVGLVDDQYSIYDKYVDKLSRLPKKSYAFDLDKQAWLAERAGHHVAVEGDKLFGRACQEVEDTIDEYLGWGTKQPDGRFRLWIYDEEKQCVYEVSLEMEEGDFGEEFSHLAR